MNLCQQSNHRVVIILLRMIFVIVFCHAVGFQYCFLFDCRLTLFRYNAESSSESRQQQQSVDDQFHNAPTTITTTAKTARKVVEGKTSTSTQQQQQQQQEEIQNNDHLPNDPATPRTDTTAEAKQRQQQQVGIRSASKERNNSNNNDTTTTKSFENVATTTIIKTNNGIQGYYLSQDMLKWNLHHTNAGNSDNTTTRKNLLTKTICTTEKHVYPFQIFRDMFGRSADTVPQRQNSTTQQYGDALKDWKLVVESKKKPNACQDSLIRILWDYKKSKDSREYQEKEYNITKQQLYHHQSCQQLTTSLIHKIPIDKGRLFSLITQDQEQTAQGSSVTESSSTSKHSPTNVSKLLLKDATPTTRSFNSTKECQQFCDTEWLQTTTTATTTTTSNTSTTTSTSTKDATTATVQWIWKPKTSAKGKGILLIGSGETSHNSRRRTTRDTNSTTMADTDAITVTETSANRSVRGGSTRNSTTTNIHKSLTSCHQHCLTAGGESLLAQRLTKAMYMPDKRKFDVRSHILVANVSPLIVYAGAEKIRICAEPINNTNPAPFPGLANRNNQWNPFQYVCNSDIGQKHPVPGKWSPTTNLGPLSMGIPNDNVRHRVETKLDQHNSALVDVLQQNWKDGSKIGMFQMFAADYLISEKEEITILEINNQPGFGNAGLAFPNPWGDALSIVWTILKTYNEYSYHHDHSFSVNNSQQVYRILEQRLSELKLETLRRLQL